MFKFSPTHQLACIAIATVAVTGVAHADPRPDAAKTAVDAAAQPATQAPKETRYCVDGPETGTILRNRECHTRADWLKRGVDPLAKR